MSRHERDELFGGNAEGRLDLGCVAAHGHFNFDAKTQSYRFTPEGKPATAFLPNLISLLQFSGTVPMIDFRPTSSGSPSNSRRRRP
jgi:hypothetical protein